MSNQVENNINKFMLAKDRARQLIQMDMDGTLDKYKKNSLSENSKPTQQPHHNQTVTKNTKLPLEILESIKNNPISQNTLETSVLTEIEKITDKKIEDTQFKPNNDKISTEHIDYSLIKMIVENCLKEYSNKYLNNQASDNSNTVKGIKIGNKFSFITENGDLYEAKLTFIKNIKNKKA